MEVIKEIRAVSAAYLEAVQAGDADRAAALFTEDAMMMPPNQLPIVGREAIRRSIRSTGPQPTLSERFLMFQASGGLAYQRSRASWLSNGKVKYTDSMDVFVQNENGEWRYAAMVWNSSEGFDEP